MKILYAHCGFDVRVRVVVCQGEVFILEGEDVLDGGIDVHVG